MIKEFIGEQTKEFISEQTKVFIIGALGGVKDVLVDSIYGVTLVGCGLLIIFQVAGYGKGFKKASILFTAYALIKGMLS